MPETRIEKRNRPPVSCEPCRTRKLKCNRGLPCDSCIKRGKDRTCQYAPNADRTRRDAKHGTVSVSERLGNLENLISSMVQTKGSPAPRASVTTSESDSSVWEERTTAVNSNMSQPVYGANLPDRGPQLDADSSEASSAHGGQLGYVESSHWSSILEDIREIRRQLSPVDGDSEPPQESETTLDSLLEAKAQITDKEGQVLRDDFDLAFGLIKLSDREDILASLPPRQVCDSLVSHYFNSRFTILPILHPVKFQHEYESFWETPAGTPTIWISLLFAILSLTASLYQIPDRSAAPGRIAPSAKMLSQRMKQCLILGRYATAKAYGLEALMVHMQSCFLRTKDTDGNLWFLMGIVIRLAIRKGYHHDPDTLPSPGISPFDGEMRRRVWASIFQVDALLSFQVGLPSMIPTEYCDTKLPQNLEYSDFDPEMSALPPPRPTSDHTTILYTIVKAPVMAGFKKIVGHIQSLIPPPYEVTLSLDTELRRAYDGLPRDFKHKPLKQSVVDSSGTIMRRITIEMLYLKSIIVLHRRFLTSRKSSEYKQSRPACLEAALEVLHRQADLHQATQPGGQLYDDRWMVSALTTTDFILAGIVICFDLHIQMRHSATGLAGRTSAAAGAGGGYFTRERASIEVSQEIWAAASAFSKEAAIAANALESTLQRIAEQNYGTSPVSLGHRLEQVGTTSNDGFESGLASFSADQSHGLAEGPEYVDWGLLDQYSQDPTGQLLDLDSWFMDAGGWMESTDLL